MFHCSRGAFCKDTNHNRTEAECPSGYFGQPPHCKCYEDNTAYFGNNFGNNGWGNRQPSRAACQRSCAEHPRLELSTNFVFTVSQSMRP